MAEEGQVVEVHSVDYWNELLQKANSSKKLMVVDFTAKWCGPCRIMAPILTDLAQKHPDVTFAKVDVDDLKSVAEDWAIEAMPTFMFLREGSIVGKVIGANKDELISTVANHLAAA